MSIAQGPQCSDAGEAFGLESSTLPLSHCAPWGAGGAKKIKKIFFFKHGHVAYQIDRDEEQNKMQVKFSS